MCSAAIKEISMIVMIIAVAVGGGAVFLVTVIVLLMAAICWLTKNHKKVDTSHGASTEQHHDEDQLEEDKNLEVQEQSAVHHAEQLVELKRNEADGCSSQQVPTEENVAYGQAMLPQISTKENVAYGHTTHESS